MTRTHQTLRLLLIAFLLGFSSCAESINDLSSEIYGMPGFSSASLSRDGLVILPTVAGEGSKDEAMEISKILDDLVTKKLPTRKILSSGAVEDRMKKDRNLAEKWDRMSPHISVHSVKGLETTRSFGQDLGMRFLLETQIQMAEEAGGAEQVRVFGRIFDTLEGRIVWEGVGEARGYVNLFFPSAPATFSKTAAVAVKGLTRKMFSD